jgi:outer membrane protein assembly factor BamB
MRSIVALALLLAASCTPASEPIGTTEWVLPHASATDDDASVGPSGHVLLSDLRGALTLVGPDGSELWTVAGDEQCNPSTPVAVVDRDGKVYVACGQPGEEANFLKLSSLAATDGSVVWRQQFVAGSEIKPTLRLDGDGVLWVLVNSDEPIDFGGGPVGGSERHGNWARFDLEGGYLDSGAFDFVVGSCGGAWPDRGGIVVSEFACTGATAIEPDGSIRWSQSEYDLGTAAFHPGGEITVSAADGLLRLDADGRELWRRELGLTLDSGDLTAVGMGVIARSCDGLSGCDVVYLQHVDEIGNPSPREYILAYEVNLLAGASFEGYRFAVSQFDSGDVDLHDRTIDVDEPTLIARSAP